MLESESKLKIHTENLEKLVERRSKEIHESEKKYRTLFKHSGDANLIIENGLFVDCNQATVDMLRYKNKKELLRTHPSELSPEKQPDGQNSFEKANEMMNIVLENGSNRFEWDHKRADGEVFPVEVLLTAISIEKESQVIHTVWKDITERKEAEEKLIYEKTFFRALLESAPEAIAVLDNEERITNINVEFTRLFGYEFDDIKDKFINDVIIPAELMEEAREYTMRAQKGERVYAESKRLHQDGSLVAISLLGAPILNAKSEKIGTYAIYRDLTEANKFRKLLFDKDKKLNSILETAINSIITINSKGKIESFNNFAENIFGYKEEELIGKNVNILMVEPDKSMHDSYMSNYMRTGKSTIIGSSREVVARKKNGETFPAELFVHRVELEGETIFIGLMNDITARVELQAKQERLNINLERAQRMESLGLLAGGVAHDLNNIIGPIIAYPDLVLMDLPNDTPVKDDLLAIKSAAERAADVISDLLALARRGKYTMEVLNFGNLIEKYVDSPEFKDAQTKSLHVVTEHKLSDTLHNIKGSKTHLHKVIMNIVNNAFDSMNGNGVLTIRTRNEYTKGKSLTYDKLPKGEYVVLEVEDQGTGISKSDISEIFDPFFTTKRQVGRRGSGLGLSVVYGIVKDHKGFIDVKSKLGVGTKFSFYFPTTTEVKKVESIRSGNYSGSESLLIVDDNEDQIIIARKLLSSLGYKVISSENGRKAVDYIKKKKVDLVLLDMIMEDDFSGLDTYKEIIKFNPGQKAIIVSGFSETEQVKEAMKLGVGKYIKKPYDVDEIGRAVREELDKKENILK